MGFILLGVLGLSAAGCVGESEKKEVVEVKNIATQTPLYPEFQKISEWVVLKPGLVRFHTYYKSDAQFSDIKRFYTRILAENGWGPPEETPPSIFVGEKRSVSYRRGDYVIVVEQDENRGDHFDIVFLWDPE